MSTINEPISYKFDNNKELRKFKLENVDDGETNVRLEHFLWRKNIAEQYCDSLKVATMITVLQWVTSHLVSIQ